MEHCVLKITAPERGAAEHWFCQGWETPCLQELELDRGLHCDSCSCQGSSMVRCDMSVVVERPECPRLSPSGPMARPHSTSAACRELPFSKGQEHNQTELDGVLCSRKYCSQCDREVQQMITEMLVSRSSCPSGMSDRYLFDTKYLLHLRAIQVIIILCCAFGPTTWIKKVQACWDLFILKNAIQ